MLLWGRKMRIRVDCIDLVYIELVKELKNIYLSVD